MAGLDRDRLDRTGYFAHYAPGGTASLKHLSDLLAPLSHEPEELAFRLLHRFGSLATVAEASENELRQCVMHNETWLEIFLGVRRLLVDAMREKIVRTRLNDNHQAMRRYLLTTMRNLRVERCVVFFADEDECLIAEEVVSEGGQAQVAVAVRRILARAMSLNAYSVLLAHNHPSGSAEPSRYDIESTQELLLTAGKLGVKIEDHLIVGRHEVVSMKLRGLL